MQDEMSSRSRDPVTGAAPSTPFGSTGGQSTSTAPTPSWSTQTTGPGATGVEAWRNVWQERGDVRLFGVGTGTLVALGSSIAAAWMFARWRHERNRPINRLRRQAGITAKDLGHAMAENELARPVGGGGAGTALLFATILLARALRNRRHETTAFDRAAVSLRDAFRVASDGRGEPMAGLRRGRWGKLARFYASELGTMRGGKLHVTVHGRSKTRELPPIPVEFGLGGVMTLAAAWYLFWRALTGRGETRQTWQTATAHREGLGT
jgi:hypothetical protein